MKWNYADLQQWITNGCDPAVAQQITKLHCENNRLTFLPSELGLLTQLQRLHCTNNQLTSLPAELGRLTQLQWLYCTNNQLTSLPAELGRLTQLQWLYCYNNQLTSLPAELGRLTQLQVLDCRHNQLTSLPAELGRLTQLQVLDCRHNQLTSLPAELGACTQLRVLNCGVNQLTSLPAELGACTQLQMLVCSYNQLTSLPAVLGACTQLRELNCGVNQLTSLPAELGACTQLQMLVCSYNQLTSLPIGSLREPEPTQRVGLGACTQLQVLYCSHNHLTSLPAELGACTQLQYLSCDHNHLTSLPIELMQCCNLVEFYYNSGNNIAYLPPHFRRFIERIWRDDVDNAVYTDTQSVHNAAIQRSVRASIEYIMSVPPHPPITTFNALQDHLLQVDDTILPAHAKALLVEYMSRNGRDDIHSTLGITFAELLLNVYSIIVTHWGDRRDATAAAWGPEAMKVLGVEIMDAECKCFTGRMSRLVNCLVGFDPRVVVGISEAEQLANVIRQVRARAAAAGVEDVAAVRDMATEALKEYGVVDAATVATWVDAIE